MQRLVRCGMLSPTLIIVFQLQTCSLRQSFPKSVALPTIWVRLGECPHQPVIRQMVIASQRANRLSELTCHGLCEIHNLTQKRHRISLHEGSGLDSTPGHTHYAPNTKLTPFRPKRSDPAGGTRGLKLVAVRKLLGFISRYTPVELASVAFSPPT